MQLEVRKYLYDIQQAAGLLDEFVTGKTFADYQRDAMLRAAVERKFEIIGEAMTQRPIHRRAERHANCASPHYRTP